MRAILIAGLLLATTAAHADQMHDQMHDREPIPDPAPQAVASGDKSPELAVALSIGVTVGGYAVMARGSNGYQVLGLTAALLGPSVGQWYAGKLGGFGIAARAGGLAMMIYGFANLWSTAEDCNACNPTDSERTRAKLYLGAGAALWVGSTIYDVVQAYRETDAHNRRLHAMFAPALVPTSYGTQAPGMAFSTTF